MFRWVPYPFLRFTPALILGVLIGLYYSVTIPTAVVAGLVILYGAMVVASPGRWQQRFSPLFGTLGLLIITGVGVVRVGQYQIDEQANHLLHHQTPYTHYVATVTADAEERKNSWRTTVRLQQVLTYSSSGTLHPGPVLEANILIYQPQADSLRLLRQGD